MNLRERLHVLLETPDPTGYAPVGSLEDFMVRTRTISYLLALAFGAGSVLTVAAVAGDSVAEAGQAKKKKKKAKKPALKKAAKLTAEQKKARAELLGSFKFGMSKDEVVAALSKQLDERYAELIKETEDVHKQDQLRKDKKKEIQAFKKSWLAFDGQKTGWDVGIIKDQYKHGTDEAMLEYWENQGGKNQRRFFFFQDGRLYKMFIQIDTTQFEAEQATFEFFSKIMTSKFGSDVADPKLSHTNYGGEIFVQAIDETRFYDAFVLLVVDTKRAREVDAIRKERIQEVKEDNKILKAVTETGDHDTPDLDANKDAVKDVIGDKKSKPE